jgi:quercetin dioxygenase-like cupin family protein
MAHRLSSLIACALLTFSVAVLAQPPAKPRAPLRPPVPFTVFTDAALKETGAKLSAGNLSSTLVPRGAVPLEVQLFHESQKSAPEVETHDTKDHLFFVVDGEVTFTLGGELESPREISPGEWRAKTARGTRAVVARKGDLLFVPRGTVHKRDTGKKGASVMMMSFWSEDKAAVAKAP